jgi:hypothetical protein
VNAGRLVGAEDQSPSCGAKLAGVIRNVVATVPTSTLCVTNRTGQYRLTLNTVVISRDALSHAVTTPTFFWYDGAGNESQTLPPVLGSVGPPTGSITTVISLVTTTQSTITYRIEKDGTDAAIVQIYWTLELVNPLRQL